MIDLTCRISTTPDLHLDVVRFNKLRRIFFFGARETEGDFTIRFRHNDELSLNRQIECGSLKSATGFATPPGCLDNSTSAGCISGN